MLPGGLMLTMTLMIGCDRSGAQLVKPSADGDTQVDTQPAPGTEPIVGESPAIATADQVSDPATPNESADADEPAQPAEQPAVSPAPVGFVDPGINAQHRHARRSAFPEPGESLDQPIAYQTLSDNDQFARELDPSEIPDIVAWDQASRYLGYDITVQGKIVTIGQSRDGKVNFLNFHPDWRGKFYAVIFDDLASTLDKSVAETFQGKTIRIKGKIEDHQGRPQIKILSMDQVEFIDG